ncbi:hypothetical protein FKB34_05675 [Glycocaulis profundi]|nr:hypothetical protein FKB34_05675 [Glycocaulis profundi]
MKILCSLLIVLCLAFAEPAEDAARPALADGRWTGSMSLGDRSLPINVWFDPADGTGRFQLIGLSSDQNPLRNVSIDGDQIAFVLPADPVHSFTGTRQGDRIAGRVDIGGSSETFELHLIGAGPND